MTFTTAVLPLGRQFATPDALRALRTAGLRPENIMDRQAHGDWGSVTHETAGANDHALVLGRGNILGIHPLGPEVLVWVQTSLDKPATTIFLPHEW